MGFASEGFTEHLTHVSSEATIAGYYRPGQDPTKPVLILLHGYPQNSLMWTSFVTEVPSEFSIYVPDLPGYGQSTKEPSPSGDSYAHSKREFAKDILEALDLLLHRSVPAKVIPYGHDRGGRVAYRMALDYPDRVLGIGVLDIVPTSVVFLSSPYPYPETLISGSTRFFFTTIFQRWTRQDELPQWAIDGIEQYCDPVNGKKRIQGSCEDYRAGATHDVEFDLQDGLDPSNLRPVFKVPILALSSNHLRRRFDVDTIWRSLAPDGLVTSMKIGQDNTGHFLINEAQEEVGETTRQWLKEHW
ncbi:hypothetical protein Clacol_006562 [Clathrus columnatus]|uniref:AB hydrolase-1 domain-containing protein n=1 Tax=Clathrus columnatus TaxID=1419009 RepID=A0AAV5AIL2_9AGAM|nr:hypothetical protein Clacol_006562 [Clathrus columnatus]